MLSLLLLLSLLWEGSLSQTLRMQRSVTVQEAMCVHIPCTFRASELRYHSPSPVYGYWFRKGVPVRDGDPVATNDPFRWVQEEDRDRFYLLGDPRLLNCSLSIMDPKLSDTGEYVFRLERGGLKFSFIMNPLYVNVTGLTQKPDIYVPENLESGKAVTLNCSFPWVCEENKTFRFSWMGAALPSQQKVLSSSPYSELSFIPGYQHHGTNLTCQLTFTRHQLSTERTIQLNVSYPVQSVTISITQDNSTADPVQNATISIAQDNSITGNSSLLVVKEGESQHLLCAANSNPSATLTWILRNQTLASSQLSDNGVLHLELPHMGPADAGEYTCLAQHPLGSKEVSLTLSVQYAPRMFGPSCFWAEERLNCTCSVQAEPAPSVRWWIGGEYIDHNNNSDNFWVLSIKSGPWINSSLIMKMDRVPSITISCEGMNTQGNQTLLFQLVPDRTDLSHVFRRGIIIGVLCGAGISTLLILCLLLLIKMFRKKSMTATPAASRGEAEDPKRSSWAGQSLDPISPAVDPAPNPAAPDDGPEELHYAYLNFQAVKAREDHGSTDPLTEYSEIKIQ
ncbi:sialic acid-binding Ig-like lectin 5 isoform X2 [Antechinus flavipes]|uniref:sialic acid-binding Ig-like lectin 5 isoform X1 n=1 Tax=Antechinus flavipes TaxID=38775 RepID=UPI002236496D|nr:sialic acid-binding Ig-like lectin 5 isoform X1 [Antechinus flavipes]XP_051845554.1 sialic acid-binding Ig-like lectin 5 isoform X2 [Antechinus flavipes]